MSRHNLIALALLVPALMQSAGFSQSGSAEAIEIKEDRFGGGRVVLLKPQVLLDEADHKLTLSAESRKRSSEPSTGVSEIDERVTLDFISLAAKSVSFGDREVRFLVDGKPVDAGRARNRIYRRGDASRPELKVGEELITAIPLATLQEIARGKRVEMRLGPFELVLSDETLTNLRRFVSVASGSNSSPDLR